MLNGKAPEEKGISSHNTGSGKTAFRLEDVVVTPTRTEREVGDLGGGVDVIPPEKIGLEAATTPDALLRDVAGLDIQGSGFLANKIRLNLRGLQGNYGVQRVLVLLDERPLNEEYLGDLDFRLVPVANVERISGMASSATLMVLSPSGPLRRSLSPSACISA